MKYLRISLTKEMSDVMVKETEHCWKKLQEIWVNGIFLCPRTQGLSIKMEILPKPSTDSIQS